MAEQTSQGLKSSDCPSLDDLLAQPPSAEQRHIILQDLEAIARGEELDIPWRRVRRLLDLGLAEILYPVITAGSKRSLSLTEPGIAFFDRPLPS